MAIVTLTLRGPDRPLTLGTPVPIRIDVKNVSSHSIWMVGVLDGAETGTRYPYYLPEIRFAGHVVAKPPAPEDPLVSPLRRADFHLLEPGAGFDPTTKAGASYLPVSTFANFRPSVPGRYEFQLVLSTESRSLDQWLGKFGQDIEREAVLERLQLIPKFTVTSNLLTVEVRE
jgi:hypothetical protein